MAAKVIGMQDASEYRSACTSGYTDCACRDCFEIAISDDMAHPDLCNECEEAGCDAEGESECEAPGAYDDGNALHRSGCSINGCDQPQDHDGLCAAHNDDSDRSGTLPALEAKD